jgi:CHAT domain-containing protein
LIKVAIVLLCLVFIGCRTKPEAPPEAPSIKGQVNASIELQHLNLGENVAKTLTSGTTHAYQIALNSAQQIYLSLDKGDLSLQVSVCAPAAKTCVEFVSRSSGPLKAPFTTEVAGVYRLEVRSLENDQIERPYRLQVEVADLPQAIHQKATLAAKAFSEAEELRARWEEASLRSAINRYAESSHLWQAAGNPNQAANVLRSAGDVNHTLSNYQQALDYYQQAFNLSKDAKDQLGMIAALVKLSYARVYLGDIRSAQMDVSSALRSIEKLSAGDAKATREEAQALNILGETYYSTGELRRAAELFERALAVWAKAGGDRRGEALCHLNIGYSLLDLGELRNADEHFQQALALWQAVDDRQSIALTQTALGMVYSLWGDLDQSLNLHRQAAELFRSIGNRQGEAAALIGVAAVYERLSRYDTALDNYTRAAELHRQIGNRDSIALTELYIGRTYYAKGEYSRALENYRQSLAWSRAVGNQNLEANVLQGIGSTEITLNQREQALEAFNQALSLYRAIGNRRKEASTLNDICYIYSKSDEPQKALTCFRQALSLDRAVGDQWEESSTLFNTALLEHATGNIPGALQQIEQSISIIESLRTEFGGKQPRAAHSASIEEYYRLYVDVLMRLHEQHPDRGFNGKALLISERSRSRSLLESLIKEGSPLYPGSDQLLLRRERELRQLLAAKSELRVPHLSGAHNQKETQEVELELRTLEAEYQTVQAQLRAQAPRYALLTQPQSLRIEDIQRELTDSDTILLEFTLGEEKSFLWAVTSNAVSSYELPGRQDIEDAAHAVYDLLTARQYVGGETPEQYTSRVEAADAEYWPRALALSKMLLGPVAGQLGTKRMLIVSDGVLQLVPFEALPDPLAGNGANQATLSTPAETFEPLLLQHEVASLPSATILVALRRTLETQQEQPAKKTIAILADPVFERNDPRIGIIRSGGNAVTKDINDDRSAHNPDDSYLSRLTRLPGTSSEARTIASLVPPGQAMVATGFDATRTRVFNDELRNYRIIHFATYGFFDDKWPEMSGIVLSLVDEYGNQQEGFLRLQDIYKLRLPADLIVMTECPPSGKKARGDGVVSLARGFMYAGSKSVISSLWAVDDRATTEFMGYFYSGLLKDQLPPAAALQTAKRKMLVQERWRKPFFWAAFVLQGEYKGNFAPPPTSSSRLLPMLVIIIGLIILVSGVYTVRRKLRRSRSL